MKLARIPARLAILAVRVYQRLISPLLPRVCRFEPSCSQYFIDAVQAYGLLRGGLKGIWRIIRCNPFSRGGFDPA
ncbi:MAG: membrane protein insertion efficiency factor YidD [Planctomycetes bacterium]|nr:membrane protein insertion efficiency factor YidD [Planctomycetota bacterium]